MSLKPHTINVLPTINLDPVTSTIQPIIPKKYTRGKSKNEGGKEEENKRK